MTIAVSPLGAPGGQCRPVEAGVARFGRQGVLVPPGPRVQVTEPMAAGVGATSHRRRPAGLPPIADDHDAALDAIVDVLVAAGLVEQSTDEGKPAMRLAERGAQIGRALAMGGEDADPEAVLAALLDANAG